MVLHSFICIITITYGNIIPVYGVKKEALVLNSYTVVVEKKCNTDVQHWCIKFKILLITFKVLQGSAPKNLYDLISVLPPSHNDLQQNKEGILKSTPKHFTKATMGDWCFMAAAQRLCNSLPISITSACTKRDFKQKLKTFLFSKAFC